MSEHDSTGEIGAAPALERTLAQLEEWRQASNQTFTAQQNLADDGDAYAEHEVQERQERRDHIRAWPDLLGAANDSVEEIVPEMEVEGGRGAFNVDEPGLPTRVLDRMAWLGWSPDAIAAQVREQVDADGNTHTRAMLETVKQLGQADGAAGADSSDITAFAETIEERSRGVVGEAEMQAHAEDWARTAHVSQGESVEVAEAGIDGGTDQPMYVGGLRGGMPRTGKTVSLAGEGLDMASAEEQPSPFVKDPLYPTGEELQAAIDRGLATGRIITFEDWARSNGFDTDQDADAAGADDTDDTDDTDEADGADGADQRQVVSDEDCEVME